jgi:hypothetical protein
MLRKCSNSLLIDLNIQSKAIGLFINVFQEGKYINEKKDRVMVMHIENFTKPLYQVFPTDQFLFYL